MTRPVPVVGAAWARSRVQDIRATEKDKVQVYRSFRPSDVVLAEVISLGDARSYYLSTARNELGVIFAESEAGAAARQGGPGMPPPWLKRGPRWPAACMRVPAVARRRDHGSSLVAGDDVSQDTNEGVPQVRQAGDGDRMIGLAPRPPSGPPAPFRSVLYMYRTRIACTSARSGAALGAFFRVLLGR